MLKRLNEIANITMGQSPSSKYYNTNQEGLPFLQGRTTFGDKYPSFDTWTTNWNKEAQSNDILFTVRAPVGDINISPKRIAIGRGLAAIHPKSVSYKYLYYLLLSNTNKFITSSAGTIFDSINKEALESIELNVHDDKMQEHIVNTIGTVDDLIETKQQIIEKLKSISTFLYKRYKVNNFNSKINLGDYCIIKTGKLNADQSVPNGKYLFFTCGQEDLYIDDYAFDCKAIIISGNGEIAVKYYEGKFNAYQRTYVLEPNKYFYLFLKECELSIEDLKMNSQGSVIRFITKGMLEKINIPINYDSEKLNKSIQNIYNIISITNKEIKKLKQIKAKLLSKYF
jgi:type I restriction enzyme S subunit